LKSLADGKHVTPNINSVMVANTNENANTNTHANERVPETFSSTKLFSAQLQLAETEAELRRVCDLLKRGNQKLYTLSEQLFAEKAEKEFYRLQVASSTDSHSATSSTSKGVHNNLKENDSIRLNEYPADKIGLCTENEKSPTVPNTPMPGKVEKADFIRMVMTYENELSILRGLVKDDESRKPRKEFSNSSNLPPLVSGDIVMDNGISFASPLAETSDREETTSAEKIGLDGITRKKYSKDRNNDGKGNAQLSSLQQASQVSRQNSENFDDEEASEQRELNVLARRYLGESDASSTLDDDNIHHIEDDREDQLSIGKNVLSQLHEKDKSFRRRQKHMDAHLSELNRGISEKEDLIHQISSTQDKYEAMRSFYENKLGQMESHLNEKKDERDNFQMELTKLQQNKGIKSNNISKLQKSLEVKNKIILDLSKKQSELKNLAKVSSRNSNVIDRLKNDLLVMKRSKVELQRQVASERKAHAEAVKNMKQVAHRKDREAAKCNKELSRRVTKAEKTAKVANSRLGDLNILRTKYKEAEKKLRMHRLKTGIMERVGVDAVMRGSRKRKGNHFKTSPMNIATKSTKNIPKSKSKKKSTINVEKLRSYINAKISDVGRKEDIAHKIANEWEDHLELISRKEEMLGEPNERREHNDNIDEELDALDAQLKYKESRIRKLTMRLGNKTFSSGKSEQRGGATQNSLLEDDEFKSVCVGLSPIVAAQAASKMLFGMVVKERKKVASLVRTACSLDQKNSEAEKMLASKDAALRTQMEDQRYERVSMANDQQGQILSLMAIVKQEEECDNHLSPKTAAEESNVNTAEFTGNDNLSKTENSSSSEKLLLMLANERIQALETQIGEMQGDVDSMKIYKFKEETARKSVEEKERECEHSRREAESLKLALHRIKETLSCTTSAKLSTAAHLINPLGIDEGSVCSEFDFTKDEKIPLQQENYDSSDQGKDRRSTMKIIEKALRPTKPISSVTIRRGTPLSSRIDQVISSSDSSSNDDEPEWAKAIFADVAMIAEGVIPPSLLQGDKTRIAEMKDFNVFERLTDPVHYTGTHKKALAERKVEKPVSKSNTFVSNRRRRRHHEKSTIQSNDANEKSHSNTFTSSSKIKVDSPKGAINNITLASIASGCRHAVFSPDKRDTSSILSAGSAEQSSIDTVTTASPSRKGKHLKFGSQLRSPESTVPIGSPCRHSTPPLRSPHRHSTPPLPMKSYQHKISPSRATPLRDKHERNKR